MIAVLPYFVLIYAIISVGILLAYQKTRLFPLYALKVTWTGFTILAFSWVLLMSGGDSKEYIQRPSGPLAIFIGEMNNGVLTGGYPDALKDLTGTTPFWVVALLFVTWASWGLLGDVRERESRQIAAWLLVVIGSFLLCVTLLLASGRRDAIAFFLGASGWLAVATFGPRFFSRYGQWLLVCLLLTLALPILRPLSQFDWGRYGHFAENYRYAWNEGHVGEYFVNSLMVTVTTVALTTFFGATAAYVLARRELAGQSLVLGTIIGSIAIPGILIQVPLFLLIKDWGFSVGTYQYSFMDSRLGLAIIYTAISLPFTIYVMTGFFKTLPGTLGEAAVIDGCGPWRTFSEIYLPLAMPGVATTGIFNFLGAWNEFNLGLIFMSNPNFKTLPIGLYELQAATQYSSAWAPMFAGIVLLCLPTFLIFIFLQERIVEGLMSGGVKG
jgi:ABC-type glycerol-3-phosphate transport system permease component